MAKNMGQAKRRATYDDLRQVPDTKVAELIDGELIVSPRPATPHAHACIQMAADLVPAFDGKQARSGPGEWWFSFEPELHFDDDVLVPDLAAWRHARMPVVPNAPAIALSPDWLAEIVSPSSARHDRIRKMPRYARAGVAWIWLVDPLAHMLESFRLTGQTWTVAASHADDDVVRVEPFDALEIPLARWWLG